MQKLTFRLLLSAAMLLTSVGCERADQPAAAGAPVAAEAPVVSERSEGPLQGIIWRLEDLDHTGIIDSSHLTVTFAEDGSVSGSSGCNQYHGSYSFEGGMLTINPNLAATLKACAESLMFQEQKFLQLLPLMQTVTIDETQALVLASPEGQTLTFREDK